MQFIGPIYLMSSDVAAVLAKSSYEALHQKMSALVKNQYPGEAELFKEDIAEDQVLSIFVHTVVRQSCRGLSDRSALRFGFEIWHGRVLTGRVLSFIWSPSNIHAWHNPFRYRGRIGARHCLVKSTIIPGMELSSTDIHTTATRPLVGIDFITN